MAVKYDNKLTSFVQCNSYTSTLEQLIHSNDEGELKSHGINACTVPKNSNNSENLLVSDFEVGHQITDIKKTDKYCEVNNSFMKCSIYVTLSEDETVLKNCGNTLSDIMSENSLKKKGKKNTKNHKKPYEINYDDPPQLFQINQKKKAHIIYSSSDDFSSSDTDIYDPTDISDEAFVTKLSGDSTKCPLLSKQVKSKKAQSNKRGTLKKRAHVSKQKKKARENKSSRLSNSASKFVHESYNHSLKSREQFVKYSDSNYDKNKCLSTSYSPPLLQDVKHVAKENNLCNSHQVDVTAVPKDEFISSSQNVSEEINNMKCESFDEYADIDWENIFKDHSLGSMHTKEGTENEHLKTASTSVFPEVVSEDKEYLSPNEKHSYNNSEEINYEMHEESNDMGNCAYHYDDDYCDVYKKTEHVTDEELLSRIHWEEEDDVNSEVVETDESAGLKNDSNDKCLPPCLTSVNNENCKSPHEVYDHSLKSNDESSSCLLNKYSPHDMQESDSLEKENSEQDINTNSSHSVSRGINNINFDTSELIAKNCKDVHKINNKVDCVESNQNNSIKLSEGDRISAQLLSHQYDKMIKFESEKHVMDNSGCYDKNLHKNENIFNIEKTELSNIHISNFFNSANTSTSLYDAFKIDNSYIKSKYSGNHSLGSSECFVSQEKTESVTDVEFLTHIHWMEENEIGESAEDTLSNIKVINEDLYSTHSQSNDATLTFSEVKCLSSSAKASSDDNSAVSETFTLNGKPLGYVTPIRRQVRGEENSFKKDKTHSFNLLADSLSVSHRPKRRRSHDECFPDRYTDHSYRESRNLQSINNASQLSVPTTSGYDMHKRDHLTKSTDNRLEHNKVMKNKSRNLKRWVIKEMNHRIPIADEGSVVMHLMKTSQISPRVVKHSTLKSEIAGHKEVEEKKNKEVRRSGRIVNGKSDRCSPRGPPLLKDETNCAIENKNTVKHGAERNQESEGHESALICPSGLLANYKIPKKSKQNKPISLLQPNQNNCKLLSETASLEKGVISPEILFPDMLHNERAFNSPQIDEADDETRVTPCKKAFMHTLSSDEINKFEAISDNKKQKKKLSVKCSENDTRNISGEISILNMETSTAPKAGINSSLKSYHYSKGSLSPKSRPSSPYKLCAPSTDDNNLSSPFHCTACGVTLFSSEQIIQCSTCQTSFHSSCMNQDFVVPEEILSSPNWKWFCDDCLGFFPPSTSPFKNHNPQSR